MGVAITLTTAPVRSTPARPRRSRTALSACCDDGRSTVGIVGGGRQTCEHMALAGQGGRTHVDPGSGAGVGAGVVMVPAGLDVGTGAPALPAGTVVCTGEPVLPGATPKGATWPLAGTGTAGPLVWPVPLTAPEEPAPAAPEFSELVPGTGSTWPLPATPEHTIPDCPPIGAITPAQPTRKSGP